MLDFIYVVNANVPKDGAIATIRRAVPGTTRQLSMHGERTYTCEDQATMIWFSMPFFFTFSLL